MKVLLTGATGFVGRHLYPALVAAGHEVRCATRHPDLAHSQFPDRTWVKLDVEEADSIDTAMEGCDAAVYLVHRLRHGGDYPELEARGAEHFARAAETLGVGRLVYLGGVVPTEGISRHLRSRQRTGEILRSASVSAVELRAAMIMGAGSASWTMVRDLAARLPAMLLPQWLHRHSHPVAVDDVVRALLVALSLPGAGSPILEVPGPERITHREVLARVAKVLGRSRLLVNVPVLTPRLSSYWIAMVTRVELQLAQELVEGIRYDLDPQEELVWRHTTDVPMPIEQAARLALADERSKSIPSGEATTRAIGIGRASVLPPPPPAAC